MNTIFFLITIVVGILLEWSTGRIAPSYIYVPFLAMGLFLWFWRLNLSLRLVAAVLTGFLADSISLLPFGTHTFLFIVLAFCTELLHLFFSNTRSRAAQTLGIAILTVLFLLLVPQFSSIIGSMQFVK